MDRAPSLQHLPSEISESPKPEGPGYDYKEIAREVLARIDQRLADLEAVAPPDHSETRFRLEAAKSNHRAAFVRRMARGLIGLLLSASVVGAMSFWWSHDEAVKQRVARWVPGFDGATTPAETPESALPATAKVIVDAAPAPAALPPRAVPNNDKPSPAPVPPQLTELMRKVDRNIAGLAQAVTELRLAHQQAAGDNAKTAADIKASLDQMAHALAMSAMAKAPEQVTQAKPPSPTSRAMVSRTRRYGPPYLSPNDAYGFMR